MDSLIELDRESAVGAGESSPATAAVASRGQSLLTEGLSRRPTSGLSVIGANMGV
jgi:hypothetical protein